MGCELLVELGLVLVLATVLVVGSAGGVRGWVCGDAIVRLWKVQRRSRETWSRGGSVASIKDLSWIQHSAARNAICTEFHT